MSIIKYIKEEMQIIEERDPAIHSKWEVFLYPSFKVMLHYRLAHKLYLKGHYFWARWVSQRGVRKTGIEIHPGAQIGKGLFIDHGNGVIIGETTIIGDNCTLYQGVTLGGTGKEHGKRHPTIGNNVMISAGAKVLGSFKIGDNSKIGSGSVVLQEVPPNSTVVGVPGRVVERKKKSAPQETMDQCNLPNPVEEDILKLQKENELLARRIYALEEELGFKKTGKKSNFHSEKNFSEYDGNKKPKEKFEKGKVKSEKEKIEKTEAKRGKEDLKKSEAKIEKETFEKKETKLEKERYAKPKDKLKKEQFEKSESKPEKETYSSIESKSQKETYQKNKKKSEKQMTDYDDMKPVKETWKEIQLVTESFKDDTLKGTEADSVSEETTSFKKTYKKKKTYYRKENRGYQKPESKYKINDSRMAKKEENYENI